VLGMSDAEFVAAFEGLTIEQFDALTARLFAGRRGDDEALCAKYRVLANHRVAQIRVIHPDWFYD
jgi:hypothetical protein